MNFSVGACLQKMRKKMHYSMERVARELHISKQGYSKYEHDGNLFAGTLIDLAALYDVTPAELLMLPKVPLARLKNQAGLSFEISANEEKSLIIRRGEAEFVPCGQRDAQSILSHSVKDYLAELIHKRRLENIEKLLQEADKLTAEEIAKRLKCSSYADLVANAFNLFYREDKTYDEKLLIVKAIGFVYLTGIDLSRDLPLAREYITLCQRADEAKENYRKKFLQAGLTKLTFKDEGKINNKLIAKIMEEETDRIKKAEKEIIEFCSENNIRPRENDELINEYLFESLGYDYEKMWADNIIFERDGVFKIRQKNREKSAENSPNNFAENAEKSENNHEKIVDKNDDNSKENIIKLKVTNKSEEIADKSENIPAKISEENTTKKTRKKKKKASAVKSYYEEGVTVQFFLKRLLEKYPDFYKDDTFGTTAPDSDEQLFDDYFIFDLGQDYLKVWEPFWIYGKKNNEGDTLSDNKNGKEKSLQTELAETMKKLRKEKKISVATLCNRLEITKSAYYAYEAERSNPPVRALIEIAACLKVSLDDLLSFAPLATELAPLLEEDEIITEKSEKNRAVIKSEKYGISYTITRDEYEECCQKSYLERESSFSKETNEFFERKQNSDLTPSSVSRYGKFDMHSSVLAKLLCEKVSLSYKHIIYPGKGKRPSHALADRLEVHYKIAEEIKAEKAAYSNTYYREILKEYLDIFLPK